MSIRLFYVIPVVVLGFILSGCSRASGDTTGAGDQTSAASPTTHTDFAKIKPHLHMVRLATDAAAAGNYPVAVEIMDTVTNAAPDVPEFRDLEAAFREMERQQTAAAIQKNAALARRRVSVELLKPAERTRVVLLMKRMQQIGQLPPDQRAAPAQELLADVQKLTLDQPNLTRGWLMQASLCLLLDDSLHGKIAARNLADLRAQESVDPKVQALLRSLQTKNWLSSEIKLPDPPPQQTATK
jgi:hypothetical protein